MKKLIEDVRQFHEAVDQPVVEKPAVPGYNRIELRASLIDEEFREVLTSLGHTIDSDGQLINCYTEVSMVKLADGLADLIYVCIGTALEFGIPLDKVWNEVQRSNMAKIGPNGEVKRRADGKVIKPEGWTPPDIEGCLK